MTELQQSRYDQLLRRVGDLKGPGSKVNDVLQELFPTLDVENVPGELLALMGTQPCFGGVVLTGSAGQRARIQLFNPVGSGKLIACSTVQVSVGTTQQIRWTVNSNALATGVGVESYRDGRLGITARPAGQIRTSDTVAATDATGVLRCISGDTRFVTDPNAVAILPPGSGLEFGSGTDATTINITFLWRERVGEPSELSF